MNTSIWAVSQAKVGIVRIRTGDQNATFRPTGQTQEKDIIKKY